MSRARNLVIGAFIGLSAAMLGASIAVRLEAMANASSSSSSAVKEGMWIYDSHTHYDEIEGVNGVQKGSDSPNRYLLERSIFGLVVGDDVTKSPILTEIVSGDASLVKWGSYGNAAHTDVTATSITTYHGEEFYLEYSGDAEATYEVKTTVAGNEEIEAFTQTLKFVPDADALDPRYSVTANNPSFVDYKGGVTEVALGDGEMAGFEWDVGVTATDSAGASVSVDSIPVCVSFDLPCVFTAFTSTVLNPKDPTRFFAYNGETIVVTFAELADGEETRDIPWHATLGYPYSDDVVYRGTIRLTRATTATA